jgi:hypothetical protein
LSEKIGRKLVIPNWDDKGDFAALRVTQLDSLGSFKPSGLEISTKLDAGANAVLQPYMPFAENPYFDVRNSFFGPGSQFEKQVGQAAAGTRSDDGRIVRDPGQIRIDPKAFSEAEGPGLRAASAASFSICFGVGMRQLAGRSVIPN